MGAPGPRRQAREIALQVLYAAEAARAIDVASVERALEGIVAEFTAPARAKEYARELCIGIAGNLKQIDECIAAASRHWKLYRLAAVDRNVLRIGCYELLFLPELPAEVVIDEAVEIARRFAGEGSPAFVNGVLDLVARERRAGPS
jgi:N utilization substance protein B